MRAVGKSAKIRHRRRRRAREWDRGLFAQALAALTQPIWLPEAVQLTIVVPELRIMRVHPPGSWGFTHD